MASARSCHCCAPAPGGSYRLQNASSQRHRLIMAALRSCHGGLDPYASKNAGIALTAWGWCIRTVHSHQAMSSSASPMPENSQSRTAVTAIVARSNRRLFGPKSPCCEDRGIQAMKVAKYRAAASQHVVGATLLDEVLTVRRPHRRLRAFRARPRPVPALAAFPADESGLAIR